MICTNHTCTIQDYCWTYGKPYDRSDRQINVQPEQDDEAGFICKEFEDYPPMAINEMI